MNRPKTIWIDADACPRIIKDIVYKFGTRLKIPITLVANSYLATPQTELIKLIMVEKGDDIADQYIIDHVKKDDLVITADIPLAAKIVEKEAIGLNPRGEIYTEENIGEILSLRNFMKEMRDVGQITGGPANLSSKDSQNFSNSINKILS
jgi:uncharacterized protein YaiI (UPF0178 family)